MRPSSTSLVSVSFATSRRTPSKDESATACGRVVDDEVDAGQVLERPNVPALAPDDPALHVVGRQLDERDRRLGRMARGDPLERVRDEVPRPAPGLERRLLLDLANHPGHLMANLLLGLLEELAPCGRRPSGPRRVRAP